MEDLIRTPETSTPLESHVISEEQIAALLAAYGTHHPRAAKHEEAIAPLADKEAQRPNAAFAPRTRQ